MNFSLVTTKTELQPILLDHIEKHDIRCLHTKEQSTTLFHLLKKKDFPSAVFPLRTLALFLTSS